MYNMNKTKFIPLFFLLIGCSIKPIPQAISIWDSTLDFDWYAKDSSAAGFNIATAEQLAGFAKLVNDGNDFKGKTIKLERNIMLNDTADWQNWVNSPPKNNWAPIGKKRFNGTFDGNNYVVSGVYINDSKGYGQGLFGYIDSGGTVKKLGLTASYIKADRGAGGIAGVNYGIISDSYSAAWITGGKIINVFVEGKATTQLEGGDFFGVLVGDNYGTISNSYAAGNVNGGWMVGGLSGSNGGTISRRSCWPVLRHR